MSKIRALFPHVWRYPAILQYVAGGCPQQGGKPMINLNHVPNRPARRGPFSAFIRLSFEFSPPSPPPHESSNEPKNDGGSGAATHLCLIVPEIPCGPPPPTMGVHFCSRRRESARAITQPWLRVWGSHIYISFCKIYMYSGRHKQWPPSPGGAFQSLIVCVFTRTCRNTIKDSPFAKGSAPSLTECHRALDGCDWWGGTVQLRAHNYERQ